MKQALKQITDYAVISVGLCIFTFAWVACLIPHEIVGGGVSGASAVLLYAMQIPMEYTYFLINVVLFAIGVWQLGRQFGVKTLYSIFLITLLFHYMPQWIPASFIEQVKSEKNLLLWAVVGGILEGTGIGVAIMRGGNSGGTDIIALIVNKYRNIAPGRILLLCDVIIIGSSVLLPGRTMLSTLYGCIMVAVGTYVVDLIVVGTKQSVQILIFSDKNDQIADRIIAVLGRGVTMLPAVGWYTKKQRNVVLVVVRKYEAVEVYRIVKHIDSRAFLSTSSVTGVYGEGFDQIKSGRITRSKSTT